MKAPERENRIQAHARRVALVCDPPQPARKKPRRDQQADVALLVALLRDGPQTAMALSALSGMSDSIARNYLAEARSPFRRTGRG